MENDLERAVFGGGCFWCTEAVFQMLRGVVSVTSGYAGGDIDNPSYEQVSGGSTGHAEVIQVDFDPSVISYRDLLEVFFSSHNPTTLNRQGNDVGAQYRSIIFYTSEEQKLQAEEYIKEIILQKKFTDPIVTEIRPLTEFYPAEGYHQDYYNENKDAPYCQLVINPKLEKLKKEFKQELIKE